jgi:hypothetical protein
MTSDVVTDLSRFAEFAARTASPAAIYAEADRVAKQLVGHRLFTLLVVVPGGGEVERIYSSNPQAYPLTGRKPIGATPWSDHVVKGKRAWLGNDMDAIRWAFPDHELIASLGCGACINVPVCALGEVVGSMNVLDREHAFEPMHVATLQVLAPILAVPFLQALKRLG